jgi:hypothetical protein
MNACLGFSAITPRVRMDEYSEPGTMLDFDLFAYSIVRQKNRSNRRACHDDGRADE